MKYPMMSEMLSFKPGKLGLHAQSGWERGGCGYPDIVLGLFYSSRPLKILFRTLRKQNKKSASVDY